MGTPKTAWLRVNLVPNMQTPDTCHQCRRVRRGKNAFISPFDGSENVISKREELRPKVNILRHLLKLGEKPLERNGPCPLPGTQKAI